MSIVSICWNSNIWCCYTSHQAFHSLTVYSNLQAQKKHRSLLDTTYFHLVKYSILHNPYLSWNMALWSTREDLESVHQNWSLYRYSRTKLGCSHHQCGIRSWNPDFPTAYNLAASYVFTTKACCINCVQHRHLVNITCYTIPKRWLIFYSACIAAIVRLAYTVQLHSNKKDYIYYFWFEGIWTHPEMASGIVVACLPVSGKFFQQLSKSKVVSIMESTVRSLLGKAKALGRNTKAIERLTDSQDTSTSDVREKGPHTGHESLDGQPLYSVSITWG